jgi:hypothetical protein
MKQTSSKEMSPSLSAKNAGISENTNTFTSLAEHKNLWYSFFCLVFFVRHGHNLHQCET